MLYFINSTSMILIDLMCIWCVLVFSSIFISKHYYNMSVIVYTINKIYTFRLIVIAPSGACIMPAGGGGIGAGGGNLWSPGERGAIGGGGGHGGGGGGGGAGVGGGAWSDVGDGAKANVSDVISRLLTGLVAISFRKLTAEKLTSICYGISVYY